MIRHCKTNGNLHYRYIGRTDEPILKEEITRIKANVYPEVELVFCSPMLRCQETASILYPMVTPIIIEDYRECDFGDFENKNYKDLTGNVDYQAFIDSNGNLPFPGGEDPIEFRNRCCNAFQLMVDDILQRKLQNIAMVVHGGTIMSILERFSIDKKPFYEWKVDNAEGFLVGIEEEHWSKGIYNLTIEETIPKAEEALP